MYSPTSFQFIDKEICGPFTVARNVMVEFLLKGRLTSLSITNSLEELPILFLVEVRLLLVRLTSLLISNVSFKKVRPRLNG